LLAEPKGARDRSLLAIPEIQRAASRPAETDRAYPVWTDAFSNLQVFRG